MIARTSVSAVGIVFLVACTAGAEPVEKLHLLTITSAQLEGGIVTEVTWDGSTVVLQGAFAAANGEIKAQYLVIPAEGTELKTLTEQSPASAEYWRRKSNRRSPTGLGLIASNVDATMPMYGVGSLQQRVGDAISMGGIQQRHVLTLGSTMLLERTSDQPPYDGETYSWSPAILNRIAYVDGKGDLWVAGSDGSRPQRLLKGDYTLPAWSDDGRLIAIVERKDGGQRWDVSVIVLPESLRTPPRS